MAEHSTPDTIHTLLTETGAHVDEAIAINARAVWMQLGMNDEAAAQRALGAGLQVVMDCGPAIQRPRRAA